jgi:ribosome-associated protein
MNAADVTEHLLRKATWRVSRSSGPGGQHRDKASTRAELVLELDSLEGLEPAVANRLAVALHLNERPLQITIEEERSLARNQAIATDRLHELVSEALKPTRRRRPTLPGRSAREARLSSKVRRGNMKRLRRPPSDPEGD